MESIEVECHVSKDCSSFLASNVIREYEQWKKEAGK
jgi:hypothetical protein